MSIVSISPVVYVVGTITVGEVFDALHLHFVPTIDFNKRVK